MSKNNERNRISQLVYYHRIDKTMGCFSGYFSAFLLFFILIYPAISLAQSSLQRYEFQHPQMGTTFGFVVYAREDSQVIKAFLEAKKEIERLNQIMSDYLPESELNQLSRSSGTDTWVKVSDELWEVMEKSLFIAKKSKGAFDPGVGPLSRLWRRAIRRQEIPDPGKLKYALSRVNYRWIKLKPSTRQILLKKKGMKLDLGGIAKGYAVDAAFEVFTNQGLPHVLVDGGGDLRMGEVSHPINKAGPLKFRVWIIRGKLTRKNWYYPIVRSPLPEPNTNTSK
jgi:thiamine biosynthesis lipoprotein